MSRNDDDYNEEDPEFRNDPIRVEGDDDNDEFEDMDNPSKDGCNDDELIDEDESGYRPLKATSPQVHSPGLSKSQVLKPGTFQIDTTNPNLSRSAGSRSSASPPFPAPSVKPRPSQPQAVETPPPQTRVIETNLALTQPVKPKREPTQSIPEPSAASLPPSVPKPLRQEPSGEVPLSSPPKTAAPVPQKVPAGTPKIQFVVPNASQGKRFDARVAPSLPKDCPPLTSIEQLNLRIEGYEDTGIQINIEGMELVFTGTPTISGETPLKFHYTIPPIRDDRPRIEQTAEVSWFINPDPRSLWKKIDPAPELPYPKPHTSHERVAGPAIIIAGSVRGRSHAHEGTFRDDDFAIDYDQASGWYLLTVCDGAGSAKFSRRGSKIACDVIREEIQAHFAGSLNHADLEVAAKACLTGKSSDQKDKICRLLYSPMGGTAMKAFKAIQTEADATDGAVLKDFSTTLIFTIAKHYSWGWFVGSFCIGDGGAGIYSKTQPVKILNTPDGGEFAGQTRFLTMPETWSSGENVMARIQFDVSNDMTALIAMTDGVSDAKFETDNRFFDTEVWHELWRDLEDEVSLSKSNPDASEQLVQWLDFWSPGNHDDRTLAILLP